MGHLGSSLGPHWRTFLLRPMLFVLNLPKIEVHTLRLRNEFIVNETRFVGLSLCINTLSPNNLTRFYHYCLLALSGEVVVLM